MTPSDLPHACDLTTLTNDAAKHCTPKTECGSVRTHFVNDINQQNETAYSVRYAKHTYNWKMQKKEKRSMRIIKLSLLKSVQWFLHRAERDAFMNSQKGRIVGISTISSVFKQSFQIKRFDC